MNNPRAPKPTLLDRAVAYINPRAGAERMAWRQMQNSYKGGVPTRMSEGWQPATGYRFNSLVERYEVANTRNRAYQAYDNNPVAQTLVDVETDNVIGDGLNYQPTTDNEAWNREAIDRYYEWLDNCSIRGGDVESGMEVQRSLWSYSRVAGDIGWALINNDRVVNGTLLVDSRIQTVRAENIATPDEFNADRNVFDGIRYDANNRPIAFYVMDRDPASGVRTFATVPARDFVWLPHMTKPGQARPPSCYTTIFDLMAHLDRYVDGVSLAAWMATVFGIVFKQSSGPREVAQLGLLNNSQGVPRRAVTLENGMVKYVGTDDEVAQVQAQQPMQQTPEFIRTMYRMLGQPFKMPLEVIAMDMSTCTFASARIGLLPFYRQCRIKAARFGSRWSRTIRWWLSRERSRFPDDPKRWRSVWPENYWSHSLLVNAWSYTDPISEPQADLLEICMGTKSPQMVIQERGRDQSQILADLEEWKRLTEGLDLGRSTYTRDPVQQNEQPPADNKDTTDVNDDA